MWLFVALIAVPIIEIALFIEVGGWIGLWPTIGVVIVTAIAGGILLRSQGFAAMGDLQHRIHAGEDPSASLAHGAMILIAGALMLTPGFFTDAVGFLLLVPPVRAALIRNFAARMTVVAMQGGERVYQGAPPHASAGHTTVDGDYEDITPDQDRHASNENRRPPG